MSVFELFRSYAVLIGINCLPPLLFVNHYFGGRPHTSFDYSFRGIPVTYARDPFTAKVHGLDHCKRLVKVNQLNELDSDEFSADCSDDTPQPHWSLVSCTCSKCLDFDSRIVEVCNPSSSRGRKHWWFEESSHFIGLDSTCRYHRIRYYGKDHKVGLPYDWYTVKNKCLPKSLVLNEGTLPRHLLDINSCLEYTQSAYVMDSMHPTGWGVNTIPLRFKRKRPFKVSTLIKSGTGFDGS